MTLATATGRECVACGEHKPAGDFYRHKSGTLYTRCKPCHYTYTQQWRAKNRPRLREMDRDRYHNRGYAEKKRASRRLREYGLTQEQYDELMELQGGLCAICMRPLPDPKGMDFRDWEIPSIDHCHDTGKVRGILHRRCNLAIEFLLSEEEAARARRYLEEGGVKSVG